MGIFGTNAPIETDLNLILHITIIALIITGYTFARRKKTMIHEKWMFSAIVLAGISLFAWMLRSYVNNFGTIVHEFYSTGVIITNLHVVFGAMTGSLAIYVVLLMKTEWLPDRFVTRKVRRLMRTTFTMWWVTFLLGVSFYAWYFLILRV